jgi:uncharacterized protein
VFPYWLAAAPVVALGAPLGSLVSRFVPRRSLLGFVGILCLAQFAWTCHHEHIVGWSLFLAAIGVLAVNLALHCLFVWGQRAVSDELSVLVSKERPWSAATAMKTARRPE